MLLDATVTTLAISIAFASLSVCSELLDAFVVVIAIHMFRFL